MLLGGPQPADAKAAEQATAAADLSADGQPTLRWLAPVLQLPFRHLAHEDSSTQQSSADAERQALQQWIKTELWSRQRANTAALGRTIAGQMLLGAGHVEVSLHPLAALSRAKGSSAIANPESDMDGSPERARVALNPTLARIYGDLIAGPVLLQRRIVGAADDGQISVENERLFSKQAKRLARLLKVFGRRLEYVDRQVAEAHVAGQLPREGAEREALRGAIAAFPQLLSALERAYAQFQRQIAQPGSSSKDAIAGALDRLSARMASYERRVVRSLNRARDTLDVPRAAELLGMTARALIDQLLADRERLYTNDGRSKYPPRFRLGDGTSLAASVLDTRSDSLLQLGGQQLVRAALQGRVLFNKADLESFNQQLHSRAQYGFDEEMSAQHAVESLGQALITGGWLPHTENRHETKIKAARRMFAWLVKQGNIPLLPRPELIPDNDVARLGYRIVARPSAKDVKRIVAELQQLRPDWRTMDQAIAAWSDAAGRPINESTAREIADAASVGVVHLWGRRDAPSIMRPSDVNRVAAAIRAQRNQLQPGTLDSLFQKSRVQVALRPGPTGEGPLAQADVRAAKLAPRATLLFQAVAWLGGEAVQPEAVSRPLVEARGAAKQDPSYVEESRPRRGRNRLGGELRQRALRLGKRVMRAVSPPPHVPLRRLAH